MKIYVITCGTYSDYHICAVTDDPASAERLKILHSDWGEASIEEYETEHPQERPETYWYVELCQHGISKCYEAPITDDNRNFLDIGEVFHLYSDIYFVNIIAKDYLHAVKAARDRFAEYKYRKAMERK